MIIIRSKNERERVSEILMNTLANTLKYTKEDTTRK